MIRNTKNFNLKKPEQGDFYNVDDFNDNSDIIDAELENRKKAQEDDEKNIKGLTNPEYDDSGTVSGIDSFPAFLNKTKSKMNIFQWYRDFKAGMQFVLHAGQIVNNCVSSDADKPLAAAQGKALQDQLTKLYSDLEIETNDLTDLLNPNCYDPSGDKWLRIYRVGNIKFLSILLKAKGLTGHETIVTDIPTKLQPASVCYGVAQGRDTGEWAVATYVPVVLTVGRETLTMSTGVNASKAVYITGMVCYV